MREGSLFNVSLSSFRQNIQNIKQKFSQKILLMIKANAYGHGILEITNFAYGQLDIEHFGCASLFEALYVRQNVSGSFNLYVFSETNLNITNNLEYYLDYNLIPVISNQAELEILLKDKRCQYIPLVLKFNTGMNRLGLDLENLDSTLKFIKKYNRKIDHIMTHFSSMSLSISDKSNQEQLKQYILLKQKIKESGLQFLNSSSCNSGAILQDCKMISGAKNEFSDSFIRPGLMAYGYCPLNFEVKDSITKKTSPSINVKPVGSLFAKILIIRDVKRGTCIGYDGVKAPVDGKLIIIAIGYGDGFLSQYSGTTISIKKKDSKQSSDEEEALIFGKINMDMTQLIISKESRLKQFDWITLWDDEKKNLNKLTKNANITVYQALTSFTNRLPRQYQDN